MRIYKVKISKDTDGLRDDAKNAVSIPKHNVYILLMKTALRIFYGVLALLCTVAVCILAYFAIFSLVKGAPSKGAATVDFNAILTVLLTTVSVIFTVCAILLAVLGIFGFRNLKRDAGRHAETQALAEIARAFDPIHLYLQNNFGTPPPPPPKGKWIDPI